MSDTPNRKIPPHGARIMSLEVDLTALYARVEELEDELTVLRQERASTDRLGPPRRPWPTHV